MDLRDFCYQSDGAIRYKIDKPWSKGVYTYATNGHICIRVPRDAAVPERKESPNAERLFSEAHVRGEPEWSDIPPHKIKRKRCDQCNGTGYYIDYDLTSCSADTENAEKCGCEQGYRLSGYAKIRGPKGEVAIASKYLALIASLPGAKIGATGGESDTVLFKFDGGEGLVMPVRV